MNKYIDLYRASAFIPYNWYQFRLSAFSSFRCTLRYMISWYTVTPKFFYRLKVRRTAAYRLNRSGRSLVYRTWWRHWCGRERDTDGCWRGDKQQLIMRGTCTAVSARESAAIDVGYTVHLRCSNLSKHVM